MWGWSNPTEAWQLGHLLNIQQKRNSLYLFKNTFARWEFSRSFSKHLPRASVFPGILLATPDIESKKTIPTLREGSGQLSRWWPVCWLMAKQMTTGQRGSLVRKLGKTVAGRGTTENRAHSSCQRHLYVGHFIRHANFANCLTVYLQICKALGEMLYSQFKQEWSSVPQTFPQSHW